LERPARRTAKCYIIGAAATTAIAQVQTKAQQIFNANAELWMFSAAPMLQSVVLDVNNNLADTVTASSVPLVETSMVDVLLMQATEVRQTIERLCDVMPEKLPPKPPVREKEKRLAAGLPKAQDS